jgi:protocatechuate 3,4-dioxygenase beta subunit
MALAGLPGLAHAAADVTPRQALGPFYPTPKQVTERQGAWRDNDLLLVPGADQPALGTPLLFTGRVLTPRGRPVPGVEVEIWQACTRARYLCSRDRREKNPRDPGFQYFGSCSSGEAGLFAFRTIVPPAYHSGVFPDWVRPSHIHVRVCGLGRRDFVTQLYFHDPAEPTNDENLRLHGRDLLIAEVPRAKRDRLIRRVDPLAEGDDVGARLNISESVEPPWAGLEARKWVDFPLVLDRELEQV